MQHPTSIHGPHADTTDGLTPEKQMELNHVLLEDDRGAPNGIEGGLGVANGLPYFYVLRDDGNAWLKNWNNQYWAYSNLGQPQQTMIAGPIGASADSNPYLYVLGADGNLHINYWNGIKFQWRIGAAPNDTAITGPAGIFEDSGGNQYVFVHTADGNLRLYYGPNGGQQWDQLIPRPSGLTIAATVGACAVNGTQAYAFVLGGDGTLPYIYWTGSGWQWANAGAPAGVTIAQPIGVSAFNQEPAIFVTGSNGNLYYCTQSGERQWHWTSCWQPPNGTTIASAIGVTVDGGSALAFVIDSNGAVWAVRPEGWEATVMPAGVAAESGIGATTLAGDRPVAFFIGNDDNAYIVTWDGEEWVCTDLGGA
jgi:hypothetical protein